MKITLSAIKADTGGVGGHECPSQEMVTKAKECLGEAVKNGMLTDGHVSFTGDDICLLMVHTKGENNESIHKFAWDTFLETTKVAKDQGLYGAGQDLLKDSFSGNVKGMGPGSAELEFEERAGEAFVLFAGDKCGPGVFNYPILSAFADPFHNSGLLLNHDMQAGFTFTVMDVDYTEADKVITLSTPNDYYKLASLLRDTGRYVIERITENATGLLAASVSTSRLRNIAGHYVGKDDPVALIRTQKQFPSGGEVVSPYTAAHYTIGADRGSHNIAVMPVKQNSTISYFDGPAVMSCATYSVHEGKLTGPIDMFDHPFWDTIRTKSVEKTLAIREQGFFNPAMAGMDELEYTGIMDTLKSLESSFVIRK